jgi:Transcriptional regulator/sugar kinase
MRKNPTGNNAYLKELNQKTILDLIRIKKVVSKAELSKLTGLSPTAVGVITSNLNEMGYIHETGIGESSGGRKPIMLELRPGSYYSIGIDIDVGNVSIVLLDITCEVIYSGQFAIPSPITAEVLVEIIEKELISILYRHSVNLDKVLGIGISIPGLIENEVQRIVLAPNLGWQDTDIRKYFKGIGTVPVYLENEAMASAICENWIGSCQNISNFICINVKSGIGSGIFTGGSLYRGTGGSAGEIGHITVDENGPRCGCGNYGCLETMASVKYMVDKAKRMVRQGSASKLNETGDIDSIDIDDVIAAARSGDEMATGIIAESARYLGIAISNLVNTLNPSKVILGKEFIKYADLAMENLKAVVAAKALQYPASKVVVDVSYIGGETSELGAAIIPLKLLFKNRNLS